jgi:ATP/maltotriose-dependent transcriptional regulator MalT
MSRQYTGEQSPLTAAVLQSLAEAQIQRGQLDLAAARLVEARAAARAHSGEEHVLYAICDGLEARLRLAHGDLAGARAMADVMAAKLEALGPAGAPYLPEVQRLRGELEAAATKG